MKCNNCKKSEAGKAAWINIEYKGVSAKVFKDGNFCIECTEKKFARDADCFDSFFIVKDGEIKVLWRFYDLLQQKEKACRVLLALGVFSHKAEGNWNVVSKDPLGLNPKVSFSYLYFTRYEDAFSYAFSRPQYCEVHYIDKVIVAP